MHKHNNVTDRNSNNIFRDDKGGSFDTFIDLKLDAISKEKIERRKVF